MAKLYDYRVDIDLRLKQGESLTFKGVKYNPPRITIYLIADPNIPFQYDYYYRIKIQYASGQEHLPLADKIYLNVSKANLGLSRSGLIEDLFPVGEDNPESKSEAESLLCTKSFFLQSYTNILETLEMVVYKSNKFYSGFAISFLTQSTFIP